MSTIFPLISLRIRLIIAYLIFNGALMAQTQFEATVVHVGDGDSLSVMTKDQQKIGIRLAGIDCPELHQAYGQKAKQYASLLAFGKTAIVRVHGRDDKGRTLATIMVGSMNLNQELVEKGLAWAYLHYSAQYVPQEKNARAKKIGLWSYNNPVPPWEFRNPGLKIANQQEKSPPNASMIYISKNGKRYHRKGCKSLPAAAQPISLKNAQMRGYSPCRLCKP